jgi:hypothetical protein
MHQLWQHLWVMFSVFCLISAVPVFCLGQAFVLVGALKKVLTAMGRTVKLQRLLQDQESKGRNHGTDPLECKQTLPS